MNLPTVRIIALAAAAALTTTVLIAGCGKEGSAPAPSSDATPPSTVAAPAFPTDLMVDASPGEATGVAAAKKAAKEGDEVIVRGRIGGSTSPFVADRAIMTIADMDTLVDCSSMEDDQCPTPWDYCCEPSEELVAGTVTIKVEGTDGKLLRQGMTQLEGIDALAVVVVKGTVGPRPNPDICEIVATAIHVEQAK